MKMSRTRTYCVSACLSKDPRDRDTRPEAPFPGTNTVTSLETVLPVVYHMDARSKSSMTVTTITLTSKPLPFDTRAGHHQIVRYFQCAWSVFPSSVRNMISTSWSKNRSVIGCTSASMNDHDYLSLTLHIGRSWPQIRSAHSSSSLSQRYTTVSFSHARYTRNSQNKSF
jgi:hypothetical protein